MAINLRNRHLLTLKHHTPREIEYLLDLSTDLKNKTPESEAISLQERTSL